MTSRKGLSRMLIAAAVAAGATAWWLDTRPIPTPAAPDPAPGALAAAESSTSPAPPKASPSPTPKFKTNVGSKVALPPSAESPPCNCKGPTPGLDALANALRVHTSSVSTIVLAPANLPVTTATEISVLYPTSPAKRLTVTYDPANGNKIVFDFPAGDGTPLKTRLDISLLEKAAKPVPFSYIAPVTIEAHYDVAVSPLHFTMPHDCDLVGQSEPYFYWDDDRGLKGKSYNMDAFDTATVPEFGRDLADVTAAGKYLVPAFYFDEHDVDLPSGLPPYGFTSIAAPQATVALLPGASRKVAFALYGATEDKNCRGEFNYTVSITLRTYSLL